MIRTPFSSLLSFRYLYPNILFMPFETFQYFLKIIVYLFQYTTINFSKILSSLFSAVILYSDIFRSYCIL